MLITEQTLASKQLNHSSDLRIIGVHDILKAGAKKAKGVAEEVLDRVQAAVGVRYL